MRRRAFLAMSSWVVLFGCDDDDDKSKNKSGDWDGFAGGGSDQISWDDPGCSDKATSGTITDSKGNKGKVKVSWDYLPGALITTLTVLCAVAVHRRDQTCNIRDKSSPS